MTEDQATWFVSLNSPMQMVGNILSGYLMDRFGRKLTIILSSIVVILASCLLSFAPSYPLLLLGCLLNGSSVGCIRPAVGLYLSEISTVTMRGALASFYALTPNAGYLYGILSGSMIPLWMFPWMMVAPCIVFLPFSFFIPDTPLWQMKQGRSEAAQSSLTWLRGAQYKMEPELKELEVLLYCSGPPPSLRVLLTRRSFLVPVSILSVLFCLHASVGSDVLSYYALTLLVFPGVDVSPFVLATLLQSSFTLGMMFAPLLMTKMNRRPQFVLGCVSISLTMLLLGLDSHFQVSMSHHSLRYLPIGLLLFFGVVFGLGIGCVPYTLSGELFPQNVRSWGCGMALAVRYVMQFVQLKVFLLLKMMLGMCGVYWVWSTTALAGAVFALCLLPETRNKTFTELEVIFHKQKQDKEPV